MGGRDQGPPFLGAHSVPLDRPRRARVGLLSLIVAPWLAFAVFAASSPNPTGPLPVPDHPRYAIQHLGEAIGMGTATITSLVQDRQGFLWLGTQNGLFRFDGIKAQRFGPKEGMLNDRVQQLLESADGKLWAAVGPAVYRFDGVRFDVLPLPPGTEIRGYPQGMAIAPGGDVYLATESGLLVVRFAEHSSGTPRTQLWTPSTGLPMAHVTAVSVVPDGTVWFGADGHLGIIRP